MTKKRHKPKFQIEQGQEIIKARDKVRKYIRMSHVFTEQGTYLKIMGVKYGNVLNAPLNDQDLENLNQGIDKVTGLLSDFKRELNNGMDKIS